MTTIIIPTACDRTILLTELTRDCADINISFEEHKRICPNSFEPIESYVHYITGPSLALQDVAKELNRAGVDFTIQDVRARARQKLFTKQSYDDAMKSIAAARECLLLIQDADFRLQKGEAGYRPEVENAEEARKLEEALRRHEKEVDVARSTWAAEERRRRLDGEEAQQCTEIAPPFLHETAAPDIKEPISTVSLTDELEQLRAMFEKYRTIVEERAPEAKLGCQGRSDQLDH